MHDEALEYVVDALADKGLLVRVGLRVLDLGGRDVNGTTRHLFVDPACYIVVDIAKHPSVDVVCDAADLDLGEMFDVVTSTECLEHAERAPEIVKTAARHLTPGGVFIATMAGPGRGPHGAAGGMIEPGEFYRNVEPFELQTWIVAAGFSTWSIDQWGKDVRCTAVR